MLHPLKPKLSTKSAFIIFIIIWFVALASSMPSLFFYNVYLIPEIGYQCLPYTELEHLMNSTSSHSSYDIHKIYIVYNIYSQYIIPFIVISCAYFRIGSHLYFSKPVGQSKYQEVIARNKRKVRSIRILFDKELVLIKEKFFLHFVEQTICSIASSLSRLLRVSFRY